MSDNVSPIGADYKIGKFGNLTNGVGVHLSRTDLGFLGEIAAFTHAVQATTDWLSKLSGKSDNFTAFKIAHNRWFIACPLELADVIKRKIKPDEASLIDLTHGRTSLLVVGPKAPWVLSKLYAIDFDQSAFPVGTGLATTHHGIFTQIYRPYDQVFDLFVFRSFARSFWHTLTRASEEVGYEVE